MKITAIGVERLRLPLDPPFLAAWDPVPRRHFDATLVRVHTDEGITGLGSGDTMDGFGGYEELFVGRDPLQIARHVRTLEAISFHAGRYWPVEAALWDIIGQVCGQPVAVLFGGALRRLPCYASFGESRGPADRAEAVLAAREAGFRAVKIRIDRENAAAGMAAVRVARAAAGDELAIMVDLNQWWRMPGDTGAALDVVQPDVVLALGMSRARTVAELALLANHWFTPHTWTNGLGLAANLHVTAGVGGGPYLEFPYDPPGWTIARRDFFLAEPLMIGPDGCLAVPEEPGLAMVIDEGAVARWTVS